MTGAEVASLTERDGSRLLANSDHPEAEAILVPNTVLHSSDGQMTLKKPPGKIVLTANQVTMYASALGPSRDSPRQSWNGLSVPRSPIRNAEKLQRRP